MRNVTFYCALLVIFCITSGADLTVTSASSGTENIVKREGVESNFNNVQEECTVDASTGEQVCVAEDGDGNDIEFDIDLFDDEYDECNDEWPEKCELLLEDSTGLKLDTTDEDTIIMHNCVRRWQFVHENCQFSCSLCDNIEDAKSSQTEDSTSLVLVHNIYSIGFPQRAEGPNKTLVLDLITATDEYMYNGYYTNNTVAEPKIKDLTTMYETRLACQNRNVYCSAWAQLGECASNPGYMSTNCAPACQTCDFLRFETRCPYNESIPAVWTKAGDLDSMFHRMVTKQEYIDAYKPRVYSAPLHRHAELAGIDGVAIGIDTSIDTSDDGIVDATADIQTSTARITAETDTDTAAANVDDNATSALLDGPWVVVLEDFLSSEECERLIALGAEREYKPSQGVGPKNYDGSYASADTKIRTSSNAWCVEGCNNDTIATTIQERMKDLLQIPLPNFEYLQLLKYNVGEFYGTHHDYIAHHRERNQGPRILTVFLYLNDVEAGGGTNFPELNNLTVYPKTGRALIWPSVLDDDPNAKDERTQHQALPVEAGIKYGANAWVHIKDFKTPWAVGCH